MRALALFIYFRFIPLRNDIFFLRSARSGAYVNPLRNCCKFRTRKKVINGHVR